MAIVHLVNSGPRGPALITQGLLALGADLYLDKDYVSLGQLIKPASRQLPFAEASLIFAGDDHELTVSRKYDKLLTVNNWWSKVIWYDYKDINTVDLAILAKAKLYFKRSTSFPNRQPIKTVYGDKKIYPLDYAAMSEYYIAHQVRDIEIGYYFNPNDNLGMRRRLVLKQLEKSNLLNSAIGVSTCTGTIARRAIEQGDCFLDYLRLLGRTKVIFTAFPDNHDGDSRTWEAFASGALVFRDKTYIKQPKPLIHGEHFLEYDATDECSIRQAIELAKCADPRIAAAGFEHVLNYHRPLNRIKYMLSTLRL